jgi:hypothetical protein
VYQCFIMRYDQGDQGRRPCLGKLGHVGILNVMHIGKLSVMCGSQVVSDVFCRFTISRKQGSVVLEQSFLT